MVNNDVEGVIRLAAQRNSQGKLSRADIAERCQPVACLTANTIWSKAGSTAIARREWVR